MQLKMLVDMLVNILVNIIINIPNTIQAEHVVNKRGKHESY